MMRFVLFISLVMLLPRTAYADVINFENGRTYQEKDEQRWIGTVLEIDGAFVKARFTHGGETEIVDIHISRIYSIYFNDRIEHTAPPQLNENKLRAPIGGNLRRLRRLFVHPFFQDQYEMAQVLGSGNATQVQGNVTAYSKQTGTVHVMVRTTSGQGMLDDVPVDYIRAWVR